MEEQKILFERLRQIKDYWVKTSLESLDEDVDLIWSEHDEEYKILQSNILEKEEKIAYSKVLDEVIKGTMHSILVMLDGGDELTDKFNIDIVNSDTKKSLKENLTLYEEFFAYLLDNEE